MTLGGAIGVPTEPPGIPTAPGEAGSTGAAGFGTPAPGGGASGAAAAAPAAAPAAAAAGAAAAAAAGAPTGEPAGAPDAGPADPEAGTDWPAGTEDPGVAEAGLPCTGEDDTVDSIGGRNAAEDADEAVVLANDAGAATFDAAAGSDVAGCPCAAPPGAATAWGCAAALPAEEGEPPAPPEETRAAPLVGLLDAAPAEDVGALPLPTLDDAEPADGKDGAAAAEELGLETEGACGNALPTAAAPLEEPEGAAGEADGPGADPAVAGN